MAWLALALLVFIGLILKKQTEDGILSGVNFNALFSFILGIGGALIVITLFGDIRWAFVIGIAGLGIGGYVGGLIFGGEN
jgi:phosphoglycerol transferase MdoB-like AlkP superfamily enzyme